MGIAERIIENLIVKGAVDAAKRAMEREGRKPGDWEIGGTVTLKPNIVIKVITYGYLVMSLLIVLIGIFTVESETDWYIFGGLAVFMLLINLLTISTYRNVKIEADSSRITRHGAFGGKKEIWWSEVKKVKISTYGSNKSVAVFADRCKIRSSSNLIGNDDLIALVYKVVNPSIIERVAR